jgi:hypothetical protein
MRRFLFLLPVAAVLAIPAPAVAMPTAAGGTDPPQNVVFYVANPGGGRVWFDAIGMGADAPAGVKAAVKMMIADGFTVRIAGRTCGWRADPCVLGWPGP